MATYNATLTLKDIAGNTTKTLTGELSDDNGAPEPIPPKPGTYDFKANFDAFPPNHNIGAGSASATDEFKKIWKQGIDQGIPRIYCLEDNTDAVRHDFWIRGGGPDGHNYVSAFMPKDSFGMGHRSCQVYVGKPKTVNASFKWRCPTPQGGVNLWTRGGGKWAGAWQFGPIQSGDTGGIRNFAIWSGGASVLGKQDIVVGLQNQPDGGQWVQPVYYGYRPIIYDHWYSIQMTMTGGTSSDPMTVSCKYLKDDDPPFNYTAHTNNSNAQGGVADVFWDFTCFFGGTASNSAPADAWFDFADMRIWTEN